MKNISFFNSILVFGFSMNVAQAACPTNSNLQVTDLGTFLEGKTICIGSGPNWDAQENHKSNGELWDYKHGPKQDKQPGDTGIGPWNDWTDQVGNWWISGNGSNKRVNYDYDRDGNVDYSYKVFGSSSLQGQVQGPYYFCNDSNNVTITDIIGGNDEDVGCN